MKKPDSLMLPIHDRSFGQRSYPEGVRFRKATNAYYCVVHRECYLDDTKTPYAVVGSTDEAEFFQSTIEQRVDSLTPKRLYIGALETLGKDRLQQTWGRIQQQGEKDYEPIFGLYLARDCSRQTLPPREGVLEVFEGFVEQIDGDVGYVTLKAETGETFYGQYLASELRTKGIRERRRFKCRMIEVEGTVKIELSPIPDREVTEVRERSIDEELEKTLGSDGPTDDY